MPLYSSDLKIFAIDGNNNERLVDFQPVIYHGYLAGMHFSHCMQFFITFLTESELDGINSGSWYHCLPIGIYH